MTMETTGPDLSKIAPALLDVRQLARHGILNAFEQWLVVKLDNERPERMRVLAYIAQTHGGKLTEEQKGELVTLVEQRFRLLETVIPKQLLPSSDDLGVLGLLRYSEGAEKAYARTIRGRKPFIESSTDPHGLSAFFADAGYDLIPKNPQPPTPDQPPAAE